MPVQVCGAPCQGRSVAEEGADVRQVQVTRTTLAVPQGKFSASATGPTLSPHNEGPARIFRAGPYWVLTSFLLLHLAYSGS